MSDIFDLTPPPVSQPEGGLPDGRDPAPATPRRGRRRKAKAVAPGAVPAAPKRRGRPPAAATTEYVSISKSRMTPDAMLRPTAGKRGRPAGKTNGAARTPKFEFATVVNAMGDLKASDATLVTKIVMALNTVNAKSRSRILGAVGKMFT